ncbi:MAG: prepilin-type N-terminal cleavage/methylation domain-containing protein [Clostridium sp.]|nr:prepilin-type N-terminal cleavage/methylation domain-containing protein [Clostridium sp.]
MFNGLRKNKRKGFTLVELIIVIAIIAILAALLLPKIGAVKENTNKTSDISNAREIAEAALEASSADKIKTDYDTWVKLDGSSASSGSVKQEVQDFMQKTPKTKSKTIPNVPSGSDFYIWLGSDGIVKVAVDDGTNKLILYPSQNIAYKSK